jgi:hypothetical protein
MIMHLLALHIPILWKRKKLRFFILLPLDVWDILVTDQLSLEEWYNAIWSGSCPNLKGEDYDHPILCHIL